MTSSSINACSLFSLKDNLRLKSSDHGLCSNLNPSPIAVVFFTKSLSLQSKLPSTTRCLKTSIFSFLNFHPSIFQIPVSNSSLTLPSQRRNEILGILSEKVVFMLFSFLISLGSFNARQAIAVPTQECSYREHLENNDVSLAHNGETETEELYLKILEKDPRNIEALKVVLFANMKHGKTKNALEYVKRLIDIEPNEVEWRLLQALSYEMIGDFGLAKKIFKDILKQMPLLLRALHGLAMVMHKNHEGPAVFKMLNKALEVARHEKKVPEERNIQILIAQMHVVEGDLEEGLKKFQSLISEDPRDFRPYLCLGIIYSLLDKKKEADEQFEIYQNLVPEEVAQRGFLDDVVLTAKTSSQAQLEKEFRTGSPYKYSK